MKTLITLDWDETVSPIKPINSLDTEFFEFKHAYKLLVRKNVINFLEELKAKEDENFIVRWVSSWDDMTSGFNKASGGVIPNFDFIDINKGKAEAIIDFAIENEIDKIVIFEDDKRVGNKVKLLDNDLILNSYSYRRVIVETYNCKAGIGITDHMIKKFWKNN